MSAATYEDLLAKAGEIIAAHNESAGSEDINFEDFKTKLAGLGGTDVASLREASWEDLESIGIPRLLAKRLAGIFRQEDGSKDEAPVFTTETASAASEEALVKAYDPRRPKNPVGEELKRRTGDRPFVVFDPDGGVHRKATLELLTELLDGEQPREHYSIGGRPYPVYRVGQRPNATADEHPLYHGQALRRDGTDDLGLNWGGLKREVRLLLHLAVGSGELRIRDNDHVHDVFLRVRDAGDEAAARLRSRYPNASQEYDRLETLGELPSLKVSKGLSGRSRRQDPFHTGSGHASF